MQKLLGLLRSCVDDYHMIEEGDRIAVGVSGGKDSLTLLVLLAKLRVLQRQRPALRHLLLCAQIFLRLLLNQLIYHQPFS